MQQLLIAAAVAALLGACGGAGPEAVTTPTLPPTSDEAAAARSKPGPAAPADPPAATPAPTEPGSASEQAIDRAVAMFIAVANVVNAAGGDCTKMAADLEVWLDRNDEERNEVMDELAKVPEEERVEEFNTKMAKHRKVLEAMQQSVSGCIGTPAFDQAWDRLEP